MRRLDRAARSECTAGRESQRVRHATGDDVETVLLFSQARDRRQQSLRIGMLGLANNSVVGACSTIRPAYMTATLSHISATTPRSCVMSRMADPNSPLSFRISVRI